jgi:glycosyltransferase involved in cell wall biosynthesis
VTSAPLVTALCLTRNRREWLPKSIACFLSQSYENSELLILSDGDDVFDLLPLDERIQLIHLAEKPFSIGEKRNFGVSQASGDVICHWDDDDWSAPGRLQRQVDALLTSGKQVAGFHSMRFTDGAKWWKYEGVGSYSLGTSLCYWRSWWETHKFPAKNIGEDNEFVKQASDSRQLYSEDAGDLMVASVHSGNTSPRNMGSNWKEL